MAFSLFIKHCQVNLALDVGMVDYKDQPRLDLCEQAQGASLGRKEVMVTGMLRLVLALGQEEILADFWALLQAPQRLRQPRQQLK
ncbi:MAG: hypothetical protein SGPRY_001755 [Prymnesium sp.]